jgi:hypothetical protein
VYQAIGILLESNKGQLDCANKAGWTPLHRAAYNGRTAACKLLLLRGASLQIVTQDAGNTALHLAATANHLGCMDALVLSGASTIMANKAGQLPLDICISDGARDLIASAVAKGGQHPLRQGYVRTQIAPAAGDRCARPRLPSPLLNPHLVQIVHSLIAPCIGLVSRNAVLHLRCCAFIGRPPVSRESPAAPSTRLPSPSVAAVEKKQGG